MVCQLFAVGEAAGRLDQQWRHDREPHHADRRSNKDLEPEENTNIEIGGRIALFDDRVQLQGAVFQTKKDNAKILDTNGDLLVGSGDAQEITGFEIGIAGAITDEWSINANATFLDTEVTDSTTTYTPVGATTPISVVGNAIAFTPETGANIWTTYNFTGPLAGLEVGGGLTYQGDVYLNTSNLSAHRWLHDASTVSCPMAGTATASRSTATTCRTNSTSPRSTATGSRRDRAAPSS